MSKSLKVNWIEINKLGDKLSSCSEELESSRKEMLNLVNNVKSGWTGEDSNKFITNFSNYLEGMKTETNYLNEWSLYFKESSNLYGGNFEECLKKVENSISSLEDVSNE